MKKHIVILGWNASFAFNTIKDATRFIEALDTAEKLSSRWCGKEYYVIVEGGKTELVQDKIITEEQYQMISAEREAKEAAEEAAKASVKASEIEEAENNG